MSADEADRSAPGPDPTTGWTMRRQAAAVVLCLFFCASFAYLWLCVDPSLFYHSFWPAESFPIFRLGMPFLRDSVLRPGGALGYVSAFLAQLYYADWSAALTVTAVATLLCVASRGLLWRAVGVRSRVAHLVTGLLFLWPYNRYWNQLTIGLGVAVVLLAAWAYAALPWRRWWARFAAFLVLALALYYGAGGFCALFAALCGLIEVVSRRRPILGAACLALGFLIPWGLGVRMAGLFWEEAFVHLLPPRGNVEWVSRKAAVVLYAFCLLLLLAPPVGRYVYREWLLGAGERLWDPKAGAVCSAVGLAVIVPLVFGLTLDTRLRGKMRLDVFSQQQRWEDVLREARHLPFSAFNVYTLWDVNRALYWTGHLGDRMFDFWQMPGGLLPVTADFFPDVGALSGANPVAFAKSSWLLLDLGRVNEAEETCAEALELLGRHPALLKHLFLTNIIKRRTGVALKFLRLLAEDPMHRAEALRLEARVRRDPSLSDYPDVERLRALLSKRQNKTGHGSLSQLLEEQVEADSTDRMALEYLMAHYLLTKQLDQFVALVPRLKGCGIATLPRHYEEAVLMYERLTDKPADLGGLQVSDEARRRLFAFESAVTRYRGDRKMAMRAVADYVHSYFYYFTFVHAPES
jgi:hypothetical protein